jgi:hypothetical protein
MSLHPDWINFQEKEELRDKIKELKKKLAEAEIRMMIQQHCIETEGPEKKLAEALEVIRFYGDKGNWFTECFSVDEDIEWIPNGKNSPDLWENADQHGGKRAREFLKKHEVGND